MDARDRSYPRFDPDDRSVRNWQACPCCNGTGSHVNPSIDAHGLTAEDFREDPDFSRDYHQGAYDVRCVQCRGNKVVPDTDEYNEDLEARHETDLEIEAERRAGA